MTGKRAFNELLTRQLIEAIEPDNEIVKRFLEKVKSIKDWETQTRISKRNRKIKQGNYGKHAQMGSYSN